MADVINDFAKGRFCHWATLPLGTDNIVVVLLQSTSLPTDNTIKRAQFLSQVLSTGTGAGLEATFTNYARKVLSAASITIVVNTSTDVVTFDLSDQTYSSAGGATNNTLGALLVCYRQTSGAADSAISIISKHGFSATTTGGNLTATIPAVATAT